MKDDTSPQKKWIDRIHTQLKWRVDGPNVSNPFDVSSSDSKLQEYVIDRLSLMAECTAKAFMDDTEIIRIEDLNNLRFQTEHPNLIDIPTCDLNDYLKSSGVWKVLIAKIDSLQQACGEELQRRQQQ